MHEASLWPANIYLTLTYDEDHLPPHGHLEAGHLKHFIKRLRRSVNRDRSTSRGAQDATIRYFACGEYGEERDRPHYHLALFNYAPVHSAQIRQGGNGEEPLYTSDELRRLWPDGNNAFGQVTARSATYIAQYNLTSGYNNHTEDGEWRPPHFLRMSLKPAIGLTWLNKYKEDLQHGYLIHDARKHGIPRYYLKKLKNDATDLYERLQFAQYKVRAARALSTTAEQLHDAASQERLEARELIHYRRKQLGKQRT